MPCLVIEAAPSGVIIAAVSDIARRSPGYGALVAALLLVLILAMMRLWRDASAPGRLVDDVEATFWCVISDPADPHR